MWLWITKPPPSTRHSKTRNSWQAEATGPSPTSLPNKCFALQTNAYFVATEGQTAKKQPATSNKQPATSNQQPATRSSWQAGCKSSRKRGISHRNPKIVSKKSKDIVPIGLLPNAREKCSERDIYRYIGLALCSQEQGGESRSERDAGFTC